MASSVEVISAFLVDFLNKTPGRTLSGTQIAQVLRIAHPDFSPASFGCYNVRNFISKYVRSVREVGRAGADFIYGVSPAASLTPTSSGAPVSDAPFVQSRSRSGYLDAKVWKTFTAPMTPFTLVGNQQTGEIRVQSSKDPEPEKPWVRVPSLSAEFHRELAVEFVANLTSDDSRKILSDTLSRPRWWNEFYSAVMGLALARQWNSFRSRKIMQNYEGSLKALGIPLSQEQTVRSTSSPAPISPPPKQLQMFQTGEDSRLRKLAIRAVERMTISELRALSIPLGYVADELEIS